MNEELEYKNDVIDQDKDLELFQQVLDNNPTSIDEVYIRPQLDLTQRIENMDYYLNPRAWLGGINIARAVNSGYIKEDQIRGWRPWRMNYNQDLYGNRETFREAKKIARYNKQNLKRAMRYAGSDQKSAADRQFYHNLGKFVTGIVSLPAAGYTLEKIMPILNNPIVQGIGAVDGIYNLFTNQGVSKTIGHFENGEYGKGGLSLAGDVLDATPLLGTGKVLGRTLKNIKYLDGVNMNLPNKIYLASSTPEQLPKRILNQDLDKEFDDVIYYDNFIGNNINYNFPSTESIGNVTPKIAQYVHVDPNITGINYKKQWLPPVGGYVKSVSYPYFDNGYLRPSRTPYISKAIDGTLVTSLDHPLIWSANEQWHEFSRPYLQYKAQLETANKSLNRKPWIQNSHIQWNERMNQVRNNTVQRLDEPRRWIVVDAPTLEQTNVTKYIEKGQLIPEYHTFEIPMEWIRGFEWDPSLKTFNRVEYIDNSHIK